MNKSRKNFYIGNPSAGATGVYTSLVFDSGESGTEWHRMSMETEIEAGARIKITCYVSDYIPNTLTPQMITGVYVNPRDILLHGMKGRYLRFEVDFSGKSIIKHIKISCPAETLLDYLPDVFRENLFADRFLSIFGSLYEEMEEKTEHSSALYDADSAPDEYVEVMAEWLALPDISLWKGNRLRALLKAGVDYYRIKGTFEGIKRILSLYCGSDCEIFFTETYHAMRYYNKSRTGETLEKLYSRDRFTFWVLIKGDINENGERAARYLLSRNKPANMKANLVFLKPSLISDKYTYIGINSVLSEYGEATLDGECLINYKTLGG